MEQVIKNVPAELRLGVTTFNQRVPNSGEMLSADQLIVDRDALLKERRLEFQLADAGPELPVVPRKKAFKDLLTSRSLFPVYLYGGVQEGKLLTHSRQLQ